MNSAIEIHDSTVAKISTIGSTTVLHFDKAYVHKSDGVPCVDSGTGWLQTIELHFIDSEVHDLPNELPVDMHDGQLELNGKLKDNIIDFPLDESGKIIFNGITINNE